jgi:hypothetical protein
MGSDSVAVARQKVLIAMIADTPQNYLYLSEVPAQESSAEQSVVPFVLVVAQGRRMAWERL